MAERTKIANTHKTVLSWQRKRSTNQLEILNVKGEVRSGNGEGRKFIELPWVREQITEKLGFTPYPGTLNVKINGDAYAFKKSLERASVIEILPVKGFCRGKCFKTFFMDNVKSAIVIPEVENYPEDVIEVIAPVNLREKFQLKDGDAVNIKILFS